MFAHAAIINRAINYANYRVRISFNIARYMAAVNIEDGRIRDESFEGLS